MVVTFYIPITPLSGHTSLRWFGTSPCRAIPEGRFLHLWCSIAQVEFNLLHRPLLHVRGTQGSLAFRNASSSRDRWRVGQCKRRQRARPKDRVRMLRKSGRQQRAGTFQHQVPYDATGSAPTSAAYSCSNALTGPLRQLSDSDADRGSGKMSSSPRSTPSKMARATDSGDAFGMSKPRVMSVSVGSVKTAWTLTPRPGQEGAKRLRRLNAAALETA